MTFRTRLALAATAAVAAAVVAASSVTYYVVSDQLHASVDRALRARADKVIIPAGAPLSAFEVPRALLGGPRGHAQLVTSTGDVIRRPDAEHVLPTDGAPEVAMGTREPFFSEATVAGVRVRILTERLSEGVAVQMARPLDEVDTTLDRLAVLLVLISAGGIGLAALLGVMVSRTAIGPVRRLTETAERVAATRDPGERLAPAGRRDELGRLAASFDEMLAALEESLRAQSQLIADASHELRTPLTSLRTNVELLERANGVAEDERRRMIAEIRCQTEELTKLLGDLLDLSRGREAPAEEVPFDDVVAAAIERARRTAPCVHFVTELEPTVVHGVPSRLESAVVNLLENAAKWSPPDGTVEVRLRDGTLTVRDHGPGIAPDDLPRVFDRFYRAADARGVPGSGLGLSIVRQVVEEHGGSVVANNAPDGGARFRLELSPTS